MNSEELLAPRVLELFEIDGCEDRLELTERDGHFNVTVEEQWAGDTVSGFGQTCSVAMNAEQAKKIADWIYARLAMTGEREHG